MAEVPAIEPDSIRAGDTTVWTREVADYPPSDGWALSYYITDRTNAYTVTATDDDLSTYTITIASGDSDAWVPGVYNWAAFVEKGTPVERHTVSQGTLRILPNLATAQTYDTRTEARVIYDDLITAYKLHIASGGQLKAFAVNGKSVEYNTTQNLLDDIRFWAAKVRAEEDAERIAQGKASKRRMGIRFNRI